MKIRTVVSLLSFYIFFATLSFGQVGKGSLLIDGGLSAQLHFVESPDFLYADYKTRIHANSINPSIAYFVTDRLALGGSLFVQNTNAYEGTSLFGLGSRIRYYFIKKENNAWFIENQLFYTTLEKIDFISGELGLGWNYFISDNFALESSFAFHKTNSNRSVYGRPFNQRWDAGFQTSLKFFLNRSSNKDNVTFSQMIRKGTTLLGTSSAGFKYRVIGDYKVLTINFNPNIGRFISQNWLLGAGLDVNYRKLDDGYYESSAGTINIGVSPFIRYYVDSKNGTFAPFLEAGSRFSRHTHVTVLPGPYPNSKIETGFFGGIGMHLFLSATTALELKASYDTYDFKSYRIGLDIGFQYFLGK